MAFFSCLMLYSLLQMAGSKIVNGAVTLLRRFDVTPMATIPQDQRLTALRKGEHLPKPGMRRLGIPEP